MDEDASSLPDCPSLLSSLLGFDTPASWSDSVNVLVQLSVSMRAHKRGGLLLVVPAGSDRWRESIVSPIAVRAEPAVLRPRGPDAAEGRRSRSPLAGRARPRHRGHRRVDGRGRRDDRDRSARAAGVRRQDHAAARLAAGRAHRRSPSRSREARPRSATPRRSAAPGTSRPRSSSTISATPSRSSRRRTDASRCSPGRRAKTWCTRTGSKRCCCRWISLDTLRAQIQADPFNLVATAIFLLAILHTFAAGRGSPAWLARARRSGSRAAASCCTSPARSRSCSASGPSSCVAAMTVVKGWTAASHYVDDTRQLHRTAVRRRHHGAGVDAADRAVRRVRAAAASPPPAAASPAAWWVDDPDPRAAAGFVHHRAGRDDDLRAAAGAAVLRSASRPMRLRYATLGLLFVNVSIGGTLTPLRGAAGADGRAPVGLGHRRSC